MRFFTSSWLLVILPDKYRKLYTQCSHAKHGRWRRRI